MTFFILGAHAHRLNLFITTENVLRNIALAVFSAFFWFCYTQFTFGVFGLINKLFDTQVCVRGSEWSIRTTNVILNCRFDRMKRPRVKWVKVLQSTDFILINTFPSIIYTRSVALQWKCQWKAPGGAGANTKFTAMCMKKRAPNNNYVQWKKSNQKREERIRATELSIYRWAQRRGLKKQTHPASTLSLRHTQQKSKDNDCNHHFHLRINRTVFSHCICLNLNGSVRECVRVCIIK